MNRRYVLPLLPALVGMAMLSACHNANPAPESQAPAPPTASKWAVAEMHPSIASATQPSQGRVTGTVEFTQVGPDVHIVAHLEGFPPNTTHGFHIHAKGDLSAPDLSSAGGHYNPTGDVHGGPETPHHHLGDLGNVVSDDRGFATAERTLKNVDLDTLIGKSVIVHAKIDDMMTNPAGNSGARVAGGVIEVQSAPEGMISAPACRRAS